MMSKRSVFLYIFLILFSYLVWGAAPAGNKGHYEISLSFSTWGLDLLRSRIEDRINRDGNDLFRDEILDTINSDYPELVLVDSGIKSTFDSGGGTFGLDFRWYPKGKNGSFSLGLGIFKSRMRISLPEVMVEMTLRSKTTAQTGHFEGNVNDAQVIIKPLSFVFSIRWDIMPTSQVKPYFTFGLGLFPISVIYNAQANFTYSGSLQVEGETPQVIFDAYSNTIEGVIEESEEDDPLKNFPFIPVLQLNLGIKGEIMKNLFLFADFGIFNGFSLNGGIAYRF